MNKNPVTELRIKMPDGEVLMDVIYRSSWEELPWSGIHLRADFDGDKPALIEVTHHPAFSGVVHDKITLMPESEQLVAVKNAPSVHLTCMDWGRHVLVGVISSSCLGLKVRSNSTKRTIKISSYRTNRLFTFTTGEICGPDNSPPLPMPHDKNLILHNCQVASIGDNREIKGGISFEK